MTQTVNRPTHYTTRARRGEGFFNPLAYKLLNPISRVGKFLYYLSRKPLVDLPVARNRLAMSRNDIAIPIMVATMTNKHN